MVCIRISGATFSELSSMTDKIDGEIDERWKKEIFVNLILKKSVS